MIFAMAVCCLGVARGQVAFADEKSDTATINRMLVEVLSLHPQTQGDAVVEFATRLVDTPYGAGTLEGDPEMLRVNLQQLDCTTFVETVMAMAMTIDRHRSAWQDFVYNLQQLRYRDGKVNGYPSRLHYISEWIVNNSHRGNLTEVTNRFAKCNYMVKSLNFMSANAGLYPALADSANLEGVKWTEIGLRSHRYPYIKAGDVGDKAVASALQNGDVIALTTGERNLDVAHMGIVVIRDGQPYLIHASSSAGRVVVTDQPLDVWLKRNRKFTGIRVVRLE